MMRAARAVAAAASSGGSSPLNTGRGSTGHGSTGHGSKAVSSRLLIEGIDIELVRKDVKHMRLTVYPPDGSVRISAPRRQSRRHIDSVIKARLPWILKQRARIAAIERLPTARFVSGERHFFLGEPHELKVLGSEGRRTRVDLVASPGHADMSIIEMRAPLSADVPARQKILSAFYRRRMKLIVPRILEHWQPIIGVEVSAWGIRQMRTRWGSCNVRTGRINLNLELMKRPIEELEYVIVHELVHLLERRHDARFWGLMDSFMPEWRTRRAALKKDIVTS